MKFNTISSIGRPIDLNYPTNRAIALLTLGVMVAGAAFQFFSDRDWVQSGLWGLTTGLAVFLAWALCREVDPDHDLAAFVASALALTGSFIWGAGSLGSILWILLLLRIVNRTAGLPSTIFDSLGALGLAAWLAWQGNWGYLVITATGLFIDGALQNGNKHQFALAALGLCLSVVVLNLKKQGLNESETSLLALGAASGLSALFIPLIAASREIDSLGDVSGEKLNPRRVQAAQVLSILTGMQAAFWSGTAGLTAFMPLWAATTGAALFLFFRLVCPGEQG